MAVKDIADLQVCLAQKQARDNKFQPFGYEILHEQTGQPLKVCYRALERAASRGLIDYGTSLRTGWLTDAGLELIKQATAPESAGPEEP